MRTTSKDITSLSDSLKKQLFKEFMQELEPVLKELTDVILSLSTDTYLSTPDDPKTSFVKKYFEARNKQLNSVRYRRHVTVMNKLRNRQKLDWYLDGAKNIEKTA